MNDIKETEGSSLLLHYYFNDESHAMDAFTHNRCEKELLTIISTISTELKIHAKVEVGVKRQGGIIEIYNFIVSSDGVAIAAYAALLIQIIQMIIPKKSKKDQIEQDLNIQNLELSIELAKDELLKRKMVNPNINEDIIKYLLDECIKLKKQKSNFYKRLRTEYKVEKVELSTSINHNAISQIVLREDFGDYILETDDFDPITDENARIEVISPVLKKGKYKWRGFYVAGNQNIEFSMNDTDFKKEVINNAVPFKNGTFINCELIIERKIDEEGNIYNSNYKVMTVYEIYEGESVTETRKGNQRRIIKESKEQQLKFDF